MKECKDTISEQQKVMGRVQSGLTSSQANEPFGALNSRRYIYAWLWLHIKCTYKGWQNICNKWYIGLHILNIQGRLGRMVKNALLCLPLSGGIIRDYSFLLLYNFLYFPHQNKIGACIIFKTKRTDQMVKEEIKQAKRIR